MNHQSGSALLFVYGTLKRGDVRHAVLQGERFVRDVVTAPIYRLYDLGECPGLVQDTEFGRAIEGELWEVSQECLKELDEVEEVAQHLYKRSFVRLSPAIHVPVHAYLYLHSIEGCPDCGTCWRPAK